MIDEPRPPARPAPLVLVVDDDAGCVRAVRRTLAHAGLATESAGTLAEASAALVALRPDCIVTEFRLPDGPALDLLTLARATLPHAGRVVLTGTVDYRVLEEVVNHGGIHAFFAKPWDALELTGGIRGVLARCRLERERDELVVLLSDSNRSLAGRLVDRTRMLVRAKHELETVFDALEGPVAIVGPGHEVLRANSAWARAAGLDVRQVAGGRCHAGLFGRDAPCDDCPVPAALRSGKAAAGRAGDGTWTATARPISILRADAAVLCRYAQAATGGRDR